MTKKYKLPRLPYHLLFTQRAHVASNVPTGTAVVWPSHQMTLFTEAATAHVWCPEKPSARPYTPPLKNQTHRCMIRVSLYEV